MCPECKARQQLARDALYRARASLLYLAPWLLPTSRTGMGCSEVSIHALARGAA